jgi:hypothetical protein
MNLSFYVRNIGKILCKEPAQEGHDRNMHKQLQCRITYQIACLDMQHAQKRQQLEGVQEIWQGLRCIIYLDNPVKVHPLLDSSQQNIGRYDNPLAST